MDHYSCVIYRRDCSCDQKYIGETVRNAKIRWNEPAKHLKENPTHKFTWTIVSKAPKNFRKCRVLEAYIIKTICPIKDQLDNDLLTIFRSGISCPLAILFIFLLKIL